MLIILKHGLRIFVLLFCRSFVFLQQNTKFYSCTQNGHSFFLQRKTKFYSWTQTFICFLQRNAKFRIVSFLLWLWNTKFLKLFRSGHLLLANKLKNLKLHQNCHSFFWPRNAKSEAVLKRSLSIRLQTTKIELNYLLFPWTFNNSKTPDKILR